MSSGYVALKNAGLEYGKDVELPPNLCIGNPQRIVDMLKKWEETGVDCINFLLNAHETVPQEEVLASLRLFGKEVMPYFKSKDEDMRQAG